MTRSKWIKSTSAVLFFAVALMVAGCGGGGGGVTPAKKSNLNLKISLPRVASSVAINSAIIEVVSYSAAGTATRVAYDTPSISYNTTTYAYEGSYFIDNIPVGENYVVKMTLVTSYIESQSVTRSAGQTSSSTYTLYAGAIIPSIEDGVTADVTVDVESTITAISAIKYAMDEEVALSNTTVMSSSILSSIASAVHSLLTNNSIYSYNFINAQVDPFTASGISALSSSISTVLGQAGLVDVTAPTVSSFLPAASATDVAYDGTAFSVIFNESMDSSVNLNTQATLTASGFSITLVKSGTGGSLTIDSTNALSYGTFSWATSVSANDKLVYTLKANSVLKAASLKTLESGTTYSISTLTVPTNLKDVAGNALSTTGIPTTGSFTTATAPYVTLFSPAVGATGVAYDGTVFAVTFSQSMDSTINLNTQTTLTASGFSITVVKSSTGASVTIDATNALSYGTFSWMTGTSSNDKLAFTLKSSSVLEAASLFTLDPETTYMISSYVVPVNLKDATGNALDVTTGIPTYGSFTTVAAPDTTAPTVLSTTPDAAAVAAMSTYLPYEAPSVVIVYSETIDTTATDASTFNIKITKSSTGSFVNITNANAGAYGTFAWSSTNVTNDTLTMTLLPSSTLSANSLFTLDPATQYTITVITAPTVTDLAGNPMDTSSIPYTGSFMTESAPL